jgi:hypothetical protein
MRENRTVCLELNVWQAEDCWLLWKGFEQYGCDCLSGTRRRMIFNMCIKDGFTDSINDYTFKEMIVLYSGLLHRGKFCSNCQDEHGRQYVALKHRTKHITLHSVTTETAILRTTTPEKASKLDYCTALPETAVPCTAGCLH